MLITATEAVHLTENLISRGYYTISVCTMSTVIWVLSFSHFHSPMIDFDTTEEISSKVASLIPKIHVI